MVKMLFREELASPLWGGTKIQSAAQQAAEFLGGGFILNYITPTQIFIANAGKFVPPHKGEAILRNC